MTRHASESAPEPCGSATGTLTTTPGIAPFDPAAERTRAVWASGEFGHIAAGYASGAAAFVDRLALTRGETVLDVACGTGNLTIPAARRGARVTGLDIAPNLLEAARTAAAEAGLDIRFDLGNAEALPYADESFDTAMSMFGVMFTARPERALAELVRVTRPGGRIALATWVPQGFIGAMLRAHRALVPPPAGTASPLAWGDEAEMRERLGAHASAIGDVIFEARTITLAWPLTPRGVVELFRETYGPSVQTFRALDAQGRATLGAELESLWSSRNTAAAGATSVEAEYLDIRIDRV